MKIQAPYCANPHIAKKMIAPVLFLVLCLILILGGGVDSDFHLLLILVSVVICLPVYMYWAKFLKKRNIKMGEVSLEGSLLKPPEDEYDFSWGKSVIVKCGRPGTLICMKFLGPEPNPVVYLKGFTQEKFLAHFPLKNFVWPLEDDFDPEVTLTLDAGNNEHKVFMEQLAVTLWEYREKNPYYSVFSKLPWDIEKKRVEGGLVSTSVSGKEGKPYDILVQAAEAAVSITRDNPAAFIGSLINTPVHDLDGTVFLAENHIIINEEDDKNRKHRLFTAVPLNSAIVYAWRDVAVHTTGGSGIGASRGSYKRIRFNLNVSSLPEKEQKISVEFEGRDPMVSMMSAVMDQFDDRLDGVIAYINHYNG